MTKCIPVGLAAAVWAAALLAGPAVAGEPGEFGVEGYLELEHLSGEIDDTLLAADLFLRYTSPTGLGFDAGLLGLTDFDDSAHALYAALTYSFGNSKISVGAPRPAYDSFGHFPAIGGMRGLQFAAMPVNGDLAELAALATDGEMALGLRYDGTFGKLAIAASALRFDGLDADDYALALRFDVTSNIAILGDWERFDPAGADTILSRLGAQVSFSAFSGGLAYFNRDTDGLRHVDGYESWVTYAATPEISVTATGLYANVFDVLGLSLRYTRPLDGSGTTSLYGQIGAADGRNFDTTLDLSVGLQF